MRTHVSPLVLALTLAGVACARTTTTATTTSTTRTTTTTTTTTQPAAAATTSALPSARAIIDRYVQAIGGREAVTRHNTIRYVGTFEMPAMGAKGDLSVVQAAPNKMAVTMNMPGMGIVMTGYDGTVGWSVNAMQGPRVLEGKELDQLRDEAGPSGMLRSPDRVRSAETVELTSMGGQPCYKVKITYHSGRESFDCYSPETGLPVGMIQRQESPMGSMEITTLVSDWKEFGGLKVPTKLRAQMMGQEMVQTIERLEFDRPEDAKAVEVPDQVKPLVRRP